MPDTPPLFLLCGKLIKLTYAKPEVSNELCGSKQSIFEATI